MFIRPNYKRAGHGNVMRNQKVFGSRTAKDLLFEYENMSILHVPR
jgi:hypothetical protein